MNRYGQDDYGFYSLIYKGSGGAAVYPDWDSTLYWEFYDSTDVLRFTATTISNPPLEQDLDSEGKFVKVANIPLTTFEAGVVKVKAYAMLDSAAIEPYPLNASAFEVFIPSYTGAYAVSEQVIGFCGVKPKDLGLDTEPQLKQQLNAWLIECMNIIDKYCDSKLASVDVIVPWVPTPELEAPALVVQVNYRMVSNMINVAKEKRKAFIGKIGDLTVKMIESLVFTKELKDTLDLTIKELIPTPDTFIDIAVVEELDAA